MSELEKLQSENEVLRKIAEPFLTVAKEYIEGRNDISMYPLWGVSRNWHGRWTFEAGPFFSRERAEAFRSKKYDYRDCVVFCFSGHDSGLYREAISEAVEYLKDREGETESVILSRTKTCHLSRKADSKQIRTYAENLKHQLDTFFETDDGIWHDVSIRSDDRNVFLKISPRTEGERSLHVDETPLDCDEACEIMRESIRLGHENIVLFPKFVGVIKNNRVLDCLPEMALLDSGTIIGKILASGQHPSQGAEK